MIHESIGLLESIFAIGVQLLKSAFAFGKALPFYSDAGETFVRTNNVRCSGELA